MSDELENRHADDLEPNVAELTRRIIESTKHSRDGDKEDPISLAKEILNGEFASLRARPQEPGDLISKQSAFDVAQKCFEDGWDGIRLYEDADGNVTEGDDDAHSWWEGYAAGVQDVQTKVDAILSAPSGPLSDEPRANENPEVVAPSVGELEHVLRVEMGEFTRYHLTCNLDDSAACHQVCATHMEGGCADKHLDPEIDQAPCVQEVYRNGCVIAEWVNDGGIESVGFDHTVELPVTYYWDGAHDFPILSVLQRILSGAAE
jgi:hypothetical protein